jgi:hypothetical protein
VVPYPGGRNLPAVFVVTYKRTTSKAPVTSPPCITGGIVYGKRANWTWTDYDEMHETGATAEEAEKFGTVEGQVFQGGNTEPVNLAALQPGESVARLVVLDTPLAWFEPGADPVVGGNTVINSDVSHYATLMEQPAFLTAQIFGCDDKTVDAWVAPPHGWAVP